MSHLSWLATATMVASILTMGGFGTMPSASPITESALMAGSEVTAPAAAPNRLAPARGTDPVTTFQVGKNGRFIASGIAAWRLPLGRGFYRASFKAGVVPATGAPDAPTGVICGVIDLNTLGPRTHVYTADSASYTGVAFPAFLSGSEVLHVRSGTRLDMVCTTEQGGFTLFGGARASFTRVGPRALRTAPWVQVAPQARDRLAFAK